MQGLSHVLLYDSCTWEEGDSSVELKLLSTEQPFTTLLLHHGSRLPATTSSYSLELWRIIGKSWAKQGHTFLDDTCRYRREQITWVSSYGRPSEEHLLLYHVVAAWIKDKKVMALGAYDHPCTLIGAVRLDRGEYIGRELGIYQSTSNISSAMLLDVKSEYQQANQEGTSWHPQKYFLLKDTIMSCTHAEVQELLTKFGQRQAQEHMAMIQAELLQRVQDTQSGRVTSH